MCASWRRPACAVFGVLLWMLCGSIQVQAQYTADPFKELTEYSHIFPEGENHSSTLPPNAHLPEAESFPVFGSQPFDWNNGQEATGKRRRPGPDVPEPMVFDLIRPLGARKGEFEVNVLGLIPLRRYRTRTPQFSFITGADQSVEGRPAFEWAPEIEYAPIDNFAVEFELPMADGRLEAYKFAAQYTLGTAFDEKFIHGFQGILFVDRSNWAVTPTLLYLAALRFDETYSAMTMFGFSHEFGSDNPLSPTMIIVNGVLFAELSEKWILGIEANYQADLDGTAALLFMPQAHWSMTEKCILQFGVGTRAQEGAFIGEAAFRAIYEY